MKLLKLLKDIYETLNGHSLRSHSEYSEDSIPNLNNLKNLFDPHFLKRN